MKAERWLTEEQWKLYKLIKKFPVADPKAKVWLENIAALESLAERNELMGGNEWVLHEGDSGFFCPECEFSKNEGHAPDCRWGKCIAGLPREIEAEEKK